MIFLQAPIQRKLMKAILYTSGAVLLLTCSAFFIYEFITFKNTTQSQLSTLGKIIASNSTAALAFDSREDADQILAALEADSHITAASLYDGEGNLFAHYPKGSPAGAFPARPGKEGYFFSHSHITGFQAIAQGDRRLGTLYIESDMSVIYERFGLYAGIVLLVIAVSLLMAYFLSKNLQHGISTPILALAETAEAVAERQDYSVRAVKLAEDELGLLTDAFNQMLERIQEQTNEITLFNQDLEQKIIERTREMELANKELEAFSYSVSHDLRAPLRAIHGYMNILEEEYLDKLDDEGKRLLSVVVRNAQKMGQLIDDLLAFSKLGRRELIKSQVSMNDMVSMVWEELRKNEGKRDIELILHDLPEALADSTTIRQVWTNLISNALKYSRNREHAVIEIGAEEKEDMLVYYVKDNGAGFDMQYYNKLFEIFQRLHSTNEFEGTGVGLAIVQRIVLKHRGRIWASAEPDKGAVFYFSLAKEQAADMVES